MLLLVVCSSISCQQKGPETDLQLEKIADLAGAGVRVGIVDPELGPAGRYAQQVLEKMGLVEVATAIAIEKNIVTYESHVRALLDKVLRHEVDAGFVYRSDILKVKDKISVIEIPASFSVFPEYALARMKGSLVPETALDFINWLQASEQIVIWQKYGFHPFSSSSHDVKTAVSTATSSKNQEVAAERPLMVFAAAVFYDVLSQLVQEYRKESGVEVEYELAGSGKLYQKLVQGAVGVCGADIFLSAAPSYVTDLKQQGLADNARIFMGNDLVVAVCK
ncbi:MAG: hypothetical protein DRH03_11075 [Deltaproteobacteria bacterium]|nr:MAG: hypothetical protein DRH03_11075 [Deltaproteobacteria bacterium]